MVVGRCVSSVSSCQAFSVPRYLIFDLSETGSYSSTRRLLASHAALQVAGRWGWPCCVAGGVSPAQRRWWVSALESGPRGVRCQHRDRVPGKGVSVCSGNCSVLPLVCVGCIPSLCLIWARGVRLPLPAWPSCCVLSEGGLSPPWGWGQSDAEVPWSPLHELFILLLKPASSSFSCFRILRGYLPLSMNF